MTSPQRSSLTTSKFCYANNCFLAVVTDIAASDRHIRHNSKIPLHFRLLYIYYERNVSLTRIGRRGWMEASQSWRELLGKIIADPQERQRLADTLNINPITLTRWATHKSNPRPDNLRPLIEVLPQYR